MIYLSRTIKLLCGQELLVGSGNRIRFIIGVLNLFRSFVLVSPKVFCFWPFSALSL